MEKEIRSIIKNGNSLSVSLPAQWCYKNGIEKGSQVGLDIEKNSLCVYPLESQQPQETAYKESIQETVTPKPKQNDRIDVGELVRGYLKKI